MIKKNTKINKKVIIIGAGAAGLLLKNILSLYFPNLKITILEKKNIENKDYESFFKKNSKYNHPNVFSNIFYYLFKKYYLKKYDFLKKNNITRIYFFKNLILANKLDSPNLITGVNSIKINSMHNKVIGVKFYDKNIQKEINCDYIFDCSASQNYFLKMNEKINNLTTLNVVKNKILVTLNVKFLNKVDEEKIDYLINNKDITLTNKNFSLTIMKQYKFHTFTYVSKLKYISKDIANKHLNDFLKKQDIYNYKIQYSIHWIHKSNLYYETKNNEILNNLIPVGDSFFKIDPSNGMGITTILFQVIYIAKTIENFSIAKYFKFSKKLFFNLSEEPKVVLKRTFFKSFFSINIKRFIPYYYILRSILINLKDKKKFKEFLDQL